MALRKTDLKPENYEYLKRQSQKTYGHSKAMTRYIERLIEQDRKRNDKN